MSGLGELKEHFPNWDDADLAATLDAHGGDITSTTNTLRNWTQPDSEEGELALTSAEQVKSSYPGSSNTGSAAVTRDAKLTPKQGETSGCCPCLGLKKSVPNTGNAPILPGKTENYQEPEAPLLEPSSNSGPYSRERVLDDPTTESGVSGVLSLEQVKSNPRMLQERKIYDDVISARLERKSPSADSLAAILLHGTKMKKRAQHAREIIALAHEHGNDSDKSPGKAQPGSGNAGKRGSMVAGFKKDGSSTIDDEREAMDGMQEGLKLLEERLVFLQLRSIKSADDGNCQFRSLSRELYGTQGYYKEVRAMICDYMMKNPDDFLPFVGDDELWREYMDQMLRDRTWGDELTLRACAEAYKVKITVITTEKENYLLHYVPDSLQNAGSSGGRHLFLSYVSPIHYNSVAPVR